jgi:hypothetical protein
MSIAAAPAGSWILDPTGKKLGRIFHGAPATTNIAFGGDDWKILYFTSRNHLGAVNVKIPASQSRPPRNSRYAAPATGGCICGSGNPIVGPGASPPLRPMRRSKAVKSARSRRSEKNPAVAMAASFSATAVTTNWLTLMPSCLARRSPTGIAGCRGMYTPEQNREGRATLKCPRR